MKRLSFILVFCAAALSAAAQKIVSVSGEYTYYAPSTITLEQAKQEALLQTRLHVRAAKFGTMINSTTNLLVENRESGEVHSRTEVQTLSTHEVRGEWIEDTREPVQEISYDRSLRNTTIIRTTVWGKAREIKAAKVDIEVHLLKDTLTGSDADVFRDGQMFYISVQSPVSGFVAVYLLDTDEESAYCLLPAATDNRGAVPIESNRRYVFFSSDYAEKNYPATDRASGTEYYFTSERSVVFNQIYVVFSPVEFFKANDRQQEHEQYVLPRETSIKQFRQWLAACKTRDIQMTEKTISVKIVK